MNIKSFLSTCCLLLGVAAVNGQQITYKAQNVALDRVLLEIEKQSNCFFLYQQKDVQNKSLKVINWEKVSLRHALDSIAYTQNMQYSIEGKTIVFSIDTKKKKNDFNGLKVEGLIVDHKQEPLIGATIRVKNKEDITVADEYGRFEFLSLHQNDILIISSTGYEEKEVNIGSNNRLRVVLNQKITALEQVIVQVGYGQQKAKNLTGAVSVVQAKDIENRIVSGTAQALQGMDPALNITFGTGAMDGGYGINVRGTPSINGGTPLVLADGIEVSLSQINPNDIESVSILKDASSAAIYGAKASSGVILITTKQGRDRGGNGVITYSGRKGFLQNTTSTDFINTGYDHVSIVNKFYNIYQGTDMAIYTEDEMKMLEERKNDKVENPDRPWTYVRDDGKYAYYGNTDWYNHFYRKTRPMQEHNLTANGGNEKIKYHVSGRLWSQDGIFNIYEDRFQSYSMFSKLDAQIKPWLKYTGTLNFTSSNYKYAGYYDEQFTIRALQSNILSSFVPLNPDGSIMQYPNQLNANSPIGAGHGGFLTANKARNSRGNTYTVLSNRLDAEITKGLVLTAHHAYGNRKRLYKYRNLPFDYSREEGVLLNFTSGTISNYYQENHYQVQDHNLNVYATYDRDWGAKHHLTAMSGIQYENYRETNLSARKNYLLSESLSSFSLATGEATVGQAIAAFRTLGIFSRANYSYAGKYLLEMTGRWDATSRFEPNQRWGFFPSVSAGWLMSDESFWQPLKQIWNSSKLRISYGSLGNQQVGNYAYIEEIKTSNSMNYTFDGTTKANYANVSDPISSSLTWETVNTSNLGADFLFLNSKLSFSGDYFIRDTKNMLAQSLTLPAVYGANTPKGNVADLRTKGWELKLSWQDQIKLDHPLRYHVTATLGDYKTTITKYNNPDKLISEYYVGRQFGEIWGYRVKGLFATDEDAAAYQARLNDKAVNNRVYTSKKENYLRAGDVEFIDLNGDGIINQGSGTVGDPGDKQIIGSTQPRYNYSLRFGADWNGFDVSIFLQGVGKRNWYPTEYAYDFWGPYSFPSLSFIHRDFMNNTWSEENPEGYFPKPRGYASYSSGALGEVNDRYLQDVGYLRLKNLTIGYTFKWKEKSSTNIRVYASGENLYYWSKLKKYSKTVDPELTVTSSTYDANSGVGYNFSKTMIFGLNIVF
ncbi:SusC/RagA family TonB-linked outer membrane protein [Sphingobacterium multivorum]|uniref:SusC/RagA family TonB-linked outer membrane protein n=1 Tax=Sphingobacterium multivorum TaxID=28454 RepID=UPI00289803A7|nr:SusC/RagA family TonB-linked outer membrane protein [Sphingobacterium multivorum]